jgi:hypothetical protein
MRYTRRTKKKGAAGYFFGETSASKASSIGMVADRRRLRQERRKKKHYKREPIARKHTVRIKGRDAETNRRVNIKFKSSKPREAVRRLAHRKELNIERVRM